MPRPRAAAACCDARARLRGRPAPPGPGQGPPPLSPFETWIALPILFTACVYNTLQLVPVAALPSSVARVLGYPSDLFRLARLATTTPTRELREALAPEGWLASASIVRLWRANYGAQAIENLLWRLSSVDGRVRGVYLCRNSTSFWAPSRSWRVPFARRTPSTRRMQSTGCSVSTWHTHGCLRSSPCRPSERLLRSWTMYYSAATSRRRTNCVLCARARTCASLHSLHSPRSVRSTLRASYGPRMCPCRASGSTYVPLAYTVACQRTFVAAHASIAPAHACVDLYARAAPGGQSHARAPGHVGGFWRRRVKSVGGREPPCRYDTRRLQRLGRGATCPFIAAFTTAPIEAVPHAASSCRSN